MKPLNIYEIKEQKFDMLIDNLNKALYKIIDNNKVKLFTLKNCYVLNNPDILYKYKMDKINHLISKLEVLNPLNTLSRGYSLVEKEGKIISSIKKVKKDDELKISLKDGEFISKVIRIGDKSEKK